MSTTVPPAPVDGSAVRWTRVGDARSYELRAGDTLLARLSWSGRLGSLANLDCGDRHLSLKRSGFLSPAISVRDRDLGQAVGSLVVHGQWSEIQVAGLGTFELRRAGMLVPAWRLATSDGRNVAHVEPVETGGHLEGGLIVVDAPFAALPTTPILLGIVWHFIVTAWFEEVTVLAAEATLQAVSG